MCSAYGFTYDDIRNSGGSVVYVAWVVSSLMKITTLTPSACVARSLVHHGNRGQQTSKIAPMSPKARLCWTSIRTCAARCPPASTRVEGTCNTAGYSGVLIANKSLPEDFLARSLRYSWSTRTDRERETRLWTCCLGRSCPGSPMSHVPGAQTGNSEEVIRARAT